MNYSIRELKRDENKILDTFLYEAIFIPEGVQMSIENWDNRQLKTGTAKVKFCPPQRSTL